MSMFPLEVLEHIFEFLSIDDQISSRATSKAVNALILRLITKGEAKSNEIFKKPVNIPIDLPTLEEPTFKICKFISDDIYACGGYTKKLLFLAFFRLSDDKNKLTFINMITEDKTRTMELHSDVFFLAGDYVLVGYKFLPGNYYESKYSIFNISTGERHFDEEYSPTFASVCSVERIYKEMVSDDECEEEEENVSKVEKSKVDFVIGHWGIYWFTYTLDDKTDYLRIRYQSSRDVFGTFESVSDLLSVDEDIVISGSDNRLIVWTKNVPGRIIELKKKYIQNMQMIDNDHVIVKLMRGVVIVNWRTGQVLKQAGCDTSTIFSNYNNSAFILTHRSHFAVYDFIGTGDTKLRRLQIFDNGAQTLLVSSSYKRPVKTVISDTIKVFFYFWKNDLESFIRCIKHNHGS